MQTDSEIEDFNRRQVFVRDACPSNWLELGEELRDAAEEVWKARSQGLRLEAVLDSERSVLGSQTKPAQSRPYLLLAGFATENVLKGLIVARDPSHISSGSLSNQLKSHNLVTLACKIQSLKLSSDESRFCDIATKSIPYWGRYPIPLKSNNVTTETVITEELRAVFLGLFDRLARQLYWRVRDGWDSGVGPVSLQIRDARYEALDLDTPLKMGLGKRKNQE